MTYTALEPHGGRTDSWRAQHVNHGHFRGRSGWAQARAQQRAKRLRLDAIMVAVLMAGVIAMVTLGKSFMDLPGIIDGVAHRTRSIDLQLFNGFDNPSVWYGPWTNTLGNIALFMPLGAVLVVLGKGRRHWALNALGATVLGFIVSLTIEVTQYVFALGYSDIDDLVCNTLGAALGGILLARRSHDVQTRILHRLAMLAAAAVLILIVSLLNGARHGLF